MARIYLASSWRNPYQPEMVKKLLNWGHAVYDFRRDARGDDNKLGPLQPAATAFAWSEMDPDWQNWTPSKYLHQLQRSPRAAQGYLGDLRGMEWADTCILCLPAGNSAHIEAGYMKGKGKRLIIYWQNDYKEVVNKEKSWKFEPDLMYLLADNLCIGEYELSECLGHGVTSVAINSVRHAIQRGT